MTISSSSMDAVLAQMRSLTQDATVATNLDNTAAKATSAAPASNSFAAELERSINRLASTENQANKQADDFMTGESTASLNDVMMDLQKANLALQTTIQVRNRFVQAYESVASMPV